MLKKVALIFGGSVCSLVAEKGVLAVTHALCVDADCFVWPMCECRMGV